MAITFRDPAAAAGSERSPRLDDYVELASGGTTRALRELDQQLPHQSPDAQEVTIEVAPGVVLRGELTLPSEASLRGVVLFRSCLSAAPARSGQSRIAGRLCYSEPRSPQPRLSSRGGNPALEDQAAEDR
jgi:hypothetical protein